MAKIKLYRGINADTQEELDQYISEFMAGGKAGGHGGEMIHGSGDYFATDRDMAESYAKGKAYSHIFEFEIDDKDLITTTDYKNRKKKKIKDVWNQTDYANYIGKIGVVVDQEAGKDNGKIVVISDREGFLAEASAIPTQKQSEAKVSKELATFYRKYLTDVKSQLQKWLDGYEDLSFSKKLEVERLMNVSNTIKELLGNPTDNIAETIKRYVQTEGTNGYNTVWYDLENAHNITLNMPFIDERYIEAVMENPVAGKTLSKNLYLHRDGLAQQTIDAISRGFLMGYSYSQMAGELSALTEADYHQAVRIARTEAGRVRTIATQKAYNNATKLGVTLEKRWLATLDMRTRSDHAELDGQTVKVDDNFKINGYEGAGPRLFGVASEDINCRCTTVPIVFGVGPDLRNDNESKKSIKWQTYTEWEKEKH